MISQWDCSGILGVIYILLKVYVYISADVQYKFTNISVKISLIKKSALPLHSVP